MYKVYFDGMTKMGSYIQNACLMFNEEPTMCELVIRLKEEGYVMFRLPHMLKLVNI